MNNKFLPIVIYLFCFYGNGLIHAQEIKTNAIATLRGTNSYEGGGADSNFVYTKIVGIVYGNNLGITGNRIQYTIRDATGGIGIFKNTNELPFELVQGDSIRAIGLVNNFNGLSQISLDSVVKLASNRPINAPKRVKKLDENSESDLVVLKGCSLSVPSSWPTSPSGSGFVAKFKRGTREFDIRIDNDCDLFNELAPVGYVDIVGIGGQFDPSIPKNSGYQLLPRALTDITPGQAPKLDVDFDKRSVSVSENAGSVQIPISIGFSPTDTFSVQVIPMDSNATSGVDYTLSSPQIITFPANLDTSQSMTLNIINDVFYEGNEVFKIKIRKINASNSFVIGPDSIINITILDDEAPLAAIPTYPIGILRGNNSFEGGVADSINVSCKITGTLYGPNLRGSNNGIQFAIRDATGGINIFSASSNFGVTLQEGDSIRAIGKVNQFNGLSQLNLDSLIVLATGRPLQAAVPVDSLSESAESNLVSITGFQIVNPTQWTTGIGTGFTVQVSNGTRTIDLRIDNDCELFNQPLPTAPIISITGLGGQFDSSIPRTSGYQLLPRRASDILINSSTSSQNRKNTISIFPNPTSGNVRMLYPEDLSNSQINFQMFNVQGQSVLEILGTPSKISTKLSQYLESSPAGYFNASFLIGKDFYRTTVVKN